MVGPSRRFKLKAQVIYKAEKRAARRKQRKRFEEAQRKAEGDERRRYSAGPEGDRASEESG